MHLGTAARAYPNATRKRTGARVTPLRVISDPARTAGRVAALDDYFRHHVLDGEHFRCPHFAACRASHPGTFFEGQLHHVGAHYDLTVNDVPTRFVVIGQEYGHGPARVSLVSRVDMGEERRLLFVGSANASGFRVWFRMALPATEAP